MVNSTDNKVCMKDIKHGHIAYNSCKNTFYLRVVDGAICLKTYYFTLIRFFCEDNKDYIDLGYLNIDIEVQVKGKANLG